MALISKLPLVVAVVIFGLFMDVNCIRGGGGQNGQNFNRQTAPMGEFQNQRAQSGGGGAYNAPYRGEQTAYQTPPNGQTSFNPNSAGHNGQQQQQQYRNTDPNDHQLRRTQSQSSMSSSNGMRDDVQLFEHFGCNENSAERVCRQNCRKNIPGYKVTCHPVDKINKKTIPVQFCLCLRVPFNGRALSGDEYGVGFNGRSDGMYTGDPAYQSNAQGYPSNTQSSQYGRSNSVGDQRRPNNNQRDQRRSMSN